MRCSAQLHARHAEAGCGARPYRWHSLRVRDRTLWFFRQTFNLHRNVPPPAQVVLTLGVVVAQIINTYTRRLPPWGWRVSLGLAGVPALVLTLGGVLLPDTPNSLVERGFEAEGRAVRRCLQLPPLC